MKKIITFLCLILLVAVMNTQVQAQAIGFNDPIKVFKGKTNLIVVRSGDINNDGIIDIVAGGLDTIYVLKGNGDGTFVTIWKNAVGTYYDMKIADLTNDGYKDLVFNYESNYIGLLINNGGTSFGTVKSYILGGDSNELALADFDQDGYLDVVAATEHDLDPHYRYAAVFINNKNGTLKNRVLYSVPYVPYDQEPNVVGFFINALDMNDDGFPDIVEPYVGKDSILIYYNKGDGTFNVPEQLSIPPGVTHTQVEDIDHDTKQDLILVGQAPHNVIDPAYKVGFYLQKSGNADQDILQTYANTYNGQFGTAVVKDINRDGEYDLTLYSEYYDDASESFIDSISVFINGGALSFSIPNATCSIRAILPYSVIGDDFNNDNLPDFAYVSEDSSVWIIFQKNLTATSIQSANEAESISLYPNPSSGLLNIHAPADQVIQAVSVYDAMGRKVFWQHNETAQENISLDLNSLAKGLYLLEEEKENGSRSIQHFVLQ